MEENYIILPVDPDTFEYQEYSDSDQNIIPTQSLDTTFDSDTDTVEFYVYDDNQNLIYPGTDDAVFLGYTIREGDVLLDPARDLRNEGYYEGDYFAYYNFYRRRLASSPSRRYFIDQISADRTEISLISHQISDENVVDSTNEFIEYRESQTYFVDFYLNFGLNRQVIANNIQLDNTLPDVPKVYIKLYEPLPQPFQLKDTLWIVEELSGPQAYRVEIPFLEVPGDDESSQNTLQGPNFNIDVSQQVGQPSERLNLNQLTSTSLSSSFQQLNSLLQEKSININVNYENREEYIKFSSAEERLKNFYFKASLIERTENTLSSSIYNITGSTTGSTSFSESRASLESIIDSTIENFDGYEYFLYYNSGSKFSWPKSSSTMPYKLLPTGSTEVLNWYGSKNDNSVYYGGQILSSSLYDEDNTDWLYRTIPEYLVEDPDNAQFELFIDMIGQHFDNIWLYTKDVTNRFDADNRLDYGISKDLVADAIRDFGVKLYSGNYDQNDLYEAFLGIRADGDPFLVSNITGSVPVPSGSGLDYVKTQVTASDFTVSLDDVQKSIYKRIYHNLPYLLKTKGTLQGLRTLISTFGIPTTILEPVEYGGTMRRPAFYQRQEDNFNYFLDMSGPQSVQTNFELHPSWSAYDNRPASMMFRFRPEYVSSQSLGPTNNNQKVFSLDTDVVLTLEYTGSAGISGSWSGSIVNPEYQFGTLNLHPEGIGNGSASIYLPFFNGDWWGVMLEYHPNDGYVLRSKNNNIDGIFERSISFSDVDSIQLTGSTTWTSASNADFGTALAPAAFFSGGLQEIRYYSRIMSEDVFSDFVLNPESFRGNSNNSSPDELAFRATLGGELYTGSESVHPKISGSWQV